MDAWRQAPARREQVAGERQRVPAGLVVLHADDNVLEHLGAPPLCVWWHPASRYTG